MLRLWTYIPLRQRNIREMHLGHNLHKDAHSIWHITFKGEQLKVAMKQGRVNHVDFRFPPALVPVLEDYLTIWRPLLLQKAEQPYPHVFLTHRGTPFQGLILRNTTHRLVYRYTGKHWHPHIVRTVWATECITKHGDFAMAAYMLNDKLETVFANYAHLLGEDIVEKAYRLIDERLSQGK